MVRLMGDYVELSLIYIIKEDFQVKNKKLFLILFMAIILVSAPILSVEASVKGNSDKLQIDLSNGVIKNGYFSLPIEESALEGMFNLAYYPGYMDETKNTFIALGVRVIDQGDWAVKKMVNVPLNTKLVTLNNVSVFTFRDQYDLNLYRIPVQLKGKEISIKVLFNGSLGKIVSITDVDGKAFSVKDGDVLKPVYKHFTANNEIENIVLEGKEVIYNSKLLVSATPTLPDKFAFKIYAISTGTEGDCISDVVNAKFITSTSTNITSSPSTWAKADIDKAKESGLTTERVLKDYQKSITREEFCELAVNLYEKLSGKTIEPVSPNPFKDTDNIAVLKAYKLGIASGTGNGEFSPNKALNREQMSKMFFSTLQLVYPSIGDSAEELSFTDKDKISIWAKQAVKYMFKEKIILGSNNLFNPQQEASREQAIALVYRVFEKFNK
jgi:hypothetical protein